MQNMKKIIETIRKRRDKRFLRRLERVLNENILEADILFRGNVGGTYDYIYTDAKRGYGGCNNSWLDNWTWKPRSEFGQNSWSEKILNVVQHKED